MEETMGQVTEEPAVATTTGDGHPLDDEDIAVTVTLVLGDSVATASATRHAKADDSVSVRKATDDAVTLALDDLLQQAEQRGV